GRRLTSGHVDDGRFSLRDLALENWSSQAIVGRIGRLAIDSAVDYDSLRPGHWRSGLASDWLGSDVVEQRNEIAMGACRFVDDCPCVSLPAVDGDLEWRTPHNNC